MNSWRKRNDIKRNLVHISWGILYWQPFTQSMQQCCLVLSRCFWSAATPPKSRRPFECNVVRKNEDMPKFDKLWQNVSTHAILTLMNITKGGIRKINAVFANSIWMIYFYYPVAHLFDRWPIKNIHSLSFARIHICVKFNGDWPNGVTCIVLNKKNFHFP